MIIVAPDSYKDCLPSAEVAAAIVSALEERLPGEKIVSLPLADGGEGTAEVLTQAMGGRLEEAVVSDPLGRPVKARYGIAGDTAIIEAAQACGLQRLTPAERNPLRNPAASTTPIPPGSPGSSSPWGYRCWASATAASSWPGWTAGRSAPPRTGANTAGRP